MFTPPYPNQDGDFSNMLKSFRYLRFNLDIPTQFRFSSVSGSRLESASPPGKFHSVILDPTWLLSFKKSILSSQLLLQEISSIQQHPFQISYLRIYAVIFEPRRILLICIFLMLTTFLTLLYDQILFSQHVTIGLKLVINGHLDTILTTAITF